MIFDGNYPSLEKLFENFSVQKVPKSGPDLEQRFELIRSCKFMKFTLPISESPNLLYLLAKHDVTPSTVYPGYQSIVSDLIMRNRWD